MPIMQDHPKINVLFTIGKGEEIKKKYKIWLKIKKYEFIQK
jgi:hypothetical protein